MLLSKIIIASVISGYVSAYDYVLVDVTKSGGLKISDCNFEKDNTGMSKQSIEYSKFIKKEKGYKCSGSYCYLYTDDIGDCLMTPDLETRCDELGGNFYIQHCSQQWGQ